MSTRKPERFTRWPAGAPVSTRDGRRVFVPRAQRIGQATIRTVVLHWMWEPHRGLHVQYTDGSVWPSAYTLPELIRSGEAVEVVSL